MPVHSIMFCLDFRSGLSNLLLDNIRRLISLSLCLCIRLCIWWFAPVSPAVQRHIMTTSCQAATCSTPHPPNPCVTLCDCGRAVNILPLPFNQFPTSNPSSLIPGVPNNPDHPSHWSYLLPKQTPRLRFNPHTHFHLHRKQNRSFCDPVASSISNYFFL